MGIVAGAFVDAADGAAPPTGTGGGAAVGPITGPGVGAMVVCAEAAVAERTSATPASAAVRRTFTPYASLPAEDNPARPGEPLPFSPIDA